MIWKLCPNAPENYILKDDAKKPWKLQAHSAVTGRVQIARRYAED